MRSWESVDVVDLAFIRERSSPTELAPPRPLSFDTDFALPAEGLDLEALNRRIVSLALEKHGGNQTRTAQYLGISRRVLEGRLQKL
jgi:DNA-binding NtrC family response regulator